jgi:DeoR family fructose operon transcriptional repressor
MNKNADRENTLLDILKVRKKMSTAEATELLNISESSARRLFADLEKGNKIMRIYGGIQLAAGNLDPSYSYDAFEKRNVLSKQSIAVYASKLISSSDILYFDCGTTIFQLALATKNRLVNGELSHIRVITNSLPNLQLLNDFCDVILIGGKYHSDRKDFAGYAAEKFVRNFNYKKSFFGADGFDPDQGFTASDAETARLSEVVISRSEKKYVLMDSSKIGELSFISFANADAIDAAITDAAVTPEQIRFCRDAGLTLSVAD